MGERDSGSAGPTLLSPSPRAARCRAFHLSGGGPLCGVRERGLDVERDGLAARRPIRVLATEHHHASIPRALRFLGFGTKSLVPL